MSYESWEKFPVSTQEKTKLDETTLDWLDAIHTDYTMTMTTRSTVQYNTVQLRIMSSYYTAQYHLVIRGTMLRSW